jgi:phage-related protein
MMRRTIIFYRTEEGRCPVEEFLDSLQAKEAQKVLCVLRIIEEFEIVPTHYFKKLAGSEEIWECRVTIRSKAYRIFTFFSNGDTVILTHGYSKKSQKTEKRQIKQAERYRRDYLKRRGRML